MTTLAEPVTQAPPPPSERAPAGPVPRRQALPGWARMLTTTLCIVAALAGWTALFLGPLSGLREAHQQSTLYSTFRDQLSSGTTPPPPFAPGSTLHRGNPVAVLSMPAIGMHRTVVVAGTRSSDLESGPGLLPGSVLPGEQGISVILGRAFSYGGPFANVHSLKSGDDIDVTTGQGTYHYSVVDSRGPGQAISRAAQSAASRLTLITAANGGWRNLWVPTHAIFVDAVLKGKPVGVAPGVTPVASDQPMKIDTGSLVVLVLWLQLLLAGVLLICWALYSWGRKQAWTLGVPVIVGTMWGVSLEFTKLLPNLL